VRIVYDPRHAGHRPRTEILYGKPLEHPERPERVEAVRAALQGSPWAARTGPPRDYALELAATVHEPAYLAHLKRRCAEAGAEGPEAEWFPYVFPRDRGMDTGTPLLGRTLDLAWASAACALTGADLLLEGAERSAYALCRPPGHHAAAGALGGYCYFNNAALAAERLLAGGARRRGAGVAILDLDIHHGNGTQDIFYASAEVLYCSLHGEPEWAYPPHTGFASETGTGAGEGYTFNQPLPRGTDWTRYAGALDAALARIARFDPAYVVLSQGFDTFEGDRWGGFLLAAEDYRRIGERVVSLGRPALAVLEGGYEPEKIAAGSLALLEGLG
jgi:acetoin utilization deacetylase AcuC-like enzyme